MSGIGMSSDESPNHRARAITDGLLATGRAANPAQIVGFIVLAARSGGFYWVTNDGHRLLRGDRLEDADDLQPNFVETMVRTGSKWRLQRGRR